MIYFELTLLAFLPVIFSAVFYLLERKTAFNKLDKILRQVIIGVVFGCIAILATEKGVPMDGYVVNVRDAAPVLAGIIFGPWAGIVAGFLGGLERWLAVFWGVGAYTRVACSVSTFVAGLFGAAVYEIMFKKQKPKWFYGLGVGVIAEVFHLTMVFVTHLDDVRKAFDVVQTVTPSILFFNAMSCLFGCLVVQILEKIFNKADSKKDHSLKSLEQIKREAKEKNKKERRIPGISAIFQVTLILDIILALIVTLGFTWNLQTELAYTDAKNIIELNIADIENDVKDKSSETLLDVTRNIAAELAKEKTLRAQGDMLNSLKEKYNVDEISIISGEGTILLSTTESIIGFYMGSGAQAAEFMPAIKGEVGSFVQDFQPITNDSSVSMKYACMRYNNSSAVQVGYGAVKLQEQVSKQASSVTNNRRVGEAGTLMVVDADFNIISSPKNDAGREVGTTGLVLNVNKIQPNEIFESEYYGVPCYALYTISEGYYVIGVYPKDEVLFSRNIFVLITVFMEVIVFGILFFLIYFIIKKLVVDNVHNVKVALKKISGGDLDVQLQPLPVEEFDSLSRNINKTVDTLKGYIDEAERRMDEELQFAKNIQAGALPRIFPPFPNEKAFDIHATMDTAKEVGGDFYDFFYTDRSKFSFVMADVSGKGVPAAMFMMTGKTLIKSLAEGGLPVDQVISKANDELCAHNDAGMFITCWFGTIDLETGIVKYVNAGHNPPLIKRKDGNFEYLKSKVNLVLACMEGVPYMEQEFQIEPGDEIFLYTDGVTEATDLNNELYGEDRLKLILDKLKPQTAKEVCLDVKKDIDKFVGEADQFDDISMLSFKYLERKGEKGKETVKVSTLHEITIEATTENVPQATAFVDGLLEQYGCPLKAQTQIDIALDELLSNIAFYAYNPQTGPATIRVEVNENPMQVIISFIDNGIPYDPLKKEDPNTNLALEDRDIGGLGIYMVKQTMDDVNYEYKNGQNILTIKKSF